MTASGDGPRGGSARSPRGGSARSPRVGVITGTGLYALPEVENATTEAVDTPFGTTRLTLGRLAGSDVAHLARHGSGHGRLSNHVSHQANVWALADAGVHAVIGFTVCGVVDPTVPLGGTLVFDDLHFPSNRLPDGSLATLYTEPDDPLRGHWIADGPYAETVRRGVVEAAHAASLGVRDGGVYGHVDGPRYNTRSEIAQLAQAGVSAISQTGGPETVLCGEAGLPFALVGYPVDHATGVVDSPTPADQIRGHVADSAEVFTGLLRAAVPRLAAAEHTPAGYVHRYEDRR